MRFIGVIQIKDINFNRNDNFNKGVETKIIGITGKMGSGKTTASCYINSKLENSVVLNVDDIAKKIYLSNKELLTKLKQCFGNEVFLCDNEINYRKLGKLVFNDCKQMKKLNELMFPLIYEEVKDYILKNKGKKKFIIIDAAVLFDAGLYNFCDKIILVKSNFKRRKKFLENKNINISEKEIDERLRGQKIKIINDKVDYIINNNSDITKFYNNLNKIINELLSNYES